MPAKLVVLDTTIVIILAGGKPPANEVRALERAQDLVTNHEADGDRVAIPAVALAECCHVREEHWGSLVVLPLNLRGAIIANRLRPNAAAAKRFGLRKQELKLDALVLATAAAHNASILYTTDGWFEGAAKTQGLKIEVRGLPALTAKQLEIESVVGVQGPRRLGPSVLTVRTPKQLPGK